MSAKLKNIISNIFGLILLGLAIYEYFNDKDMYFILFLGSFGLAAIVYKISESRAVFDRVIDNFTGKSNKKDSSLVGGRPKDRE